MLIVAMLVLWVVNFITAIFGCFTYSNKKINDELLRVWTYTFLAGVSVTIIHWTLAYFGWSI